MKPKKKTCATKRENLVAQFPEFEHFREFILPEIRHRFEPQTDGLKSAYVILQLRGGGFSCNCSWILWHRKRK